MPLGPGGASGSGSASAADRSILDGLNNGMTVAGLPSLLAATAGVLATYSRADGWLRSGRYLSTITSMARVGDPMFDLLPTASRFGGTANLVADVWDMKGLSGVFAEGSRAGSLVGKFGVLGPIAIGISGAQLATSIVEGDTRGIIENGLGTGLAVGAVFAPPPINVACGIAGLGLAAYQNIPAVHDAVDAVGEGIGDVAEGIGDAAPTRGTASSDQPDPRARWRREATSGRPRPVSARDGHRQDGPEHRDPRRSTTHGH